MRMRRWSLGKKVIVMNSLILLLATASFGFVAYELNAGATLIRGQAAALARLETVNTVSDRFSQFRYWLTDLSLSWLNESEEKAAAEGDELKALLTSLETTDPEAAAELREAVDEFEATMMKSVDAFVDENRVLGNSLVSEGRQVAATMGHVLAGLRTAAAADARSAGATVRERNLRARNFGWAALGGLLLVSLPFPVYLAKSVFKPFNRIISGLEECTEQVNDAAGQVSSASQQLAEGASDQASSLEETSAALEQMASMTRANAENSQKANELTDKAQQAAENGNVVVERLNESMRGIGKASDHYVAVQSNYQRP